MQTVWNKKKIYISNNLIFAFYRTKAELPFLFHSIFRAFCFMSLCTFPLKANQDQFWGKGYDI